MSSKSFPIMNRVNEVLRRMDDNSSQPDAMKTCFGILAIMSREDVNKLLIARDGMETILNVMTQHVDKTDIQESGCDLIWSLAFNNNAVKETIAKHGGASVLVRALKRHCKNAEFLKSACGALSNMCQSKLNQEGIASQGGLQPLVGSIHVHQTNSKLLPFIFDALASLIVSNEENARTVSSLGIIPLIVSTLARHKVAMDVAKSGCHALAILSDVKGQASKIAFAGGVSIILTLLDLHPSYADLHRVAAVVILRMLQESSHVGREITCNEGIRILLKSLDKGGAQQDTVAAVTHILFTVTNPSSPSSSNIESQLWLERGKTDDDNNNNSGSPSKKGNRNKKGDSGNENNFFGSLNRGSQQHNSSPLNTSHKHMNAPETALAGLVNILGQYSERRDVVRAACRLLNNLGGFPGVIAALEKLFVLDRVLECAGFHGETRDVIDSTAALLKAIHRKAVPMISDSTACINGLLHVIHCKNQDEDLLLAGYETLSKYMETHKSKLHEFDPHRTATRDNGSTKASPAKERVWEKDSLTLSVTVMDKMSGIQDIRSPGRESPTSMQNKQGSRRVIWSKTSPRILTSILTLFDTYYASKKCNVTSDISKEIMRSLKALRDAIPVRSTDLMKRIDAVLQFDSTEASFEKMSTELKVDESKVMDKEEPLKKEKSFTASPRKGAHGNNDRKSDSSNKMNKIAYPAYICSSGVTIPRVWRTEDDYKIDCDYIYTTSSANDNIDGNIPKRLLPLHPVTYFQKLAGRNIDYTQIPRLLETWPTYLERLIPNPTASISRNFSTNASNMGDRMHIIYEGGSAAGRGLGSRCNSPAPYQVPNGGVGAPFEHSLSFDSEFESGNLHRAVQRGDANYDLFLRSDLHTAGHTQWFYFAVSNTHPPALLRLSEQGVQVPPVRVRFNIVNLTKPDSLFNLGMRPVVYSCLDAATKNMGWVRGGADISYYSNSYSRTNNAGEGINYYYTLSFTIEFHNPQDTVLIAYTYPYTYSDYKAHIGKILARPNANDIIRSSRLTQTLSGEDCDLLVITNYKGPDKDRIGPTNLATAETYKYDEAQKRVGGTMGRPSNANNQQSKQLKPCLFLSCRVHPGETPASWMMKGTLDFLTSDCVQAQLLRQVYVIFIVPMLNPDGVIYGNNRCSLAGVDLNRQWKIPMKGLHPTIYNLKALMQAQRRLRECVMYIDLHGHSRKYNVFMYGCDEKKKPRPQVRAFPRFFSMHHIGKKYVSYADCSFHVRKGRESTARVVVGREMNIPCSFTLEATFCGSNYGPLKHCHMHVGHLQETGAAMCDAILNFSISEGKVNDALSVPANVKAVAQIEMAIAEEDGGNITGYGSAIINEHGPAFATALASSNQNKKDIYSTGIIVNNPNTHDTTPSSNSTFYKAMNNHYNNNISTTSDLKGTNSSANTNTNGNTKIASSSNVLGGDSDGDWANDSIKANGNGSSGGYAKRREGDGVVGIIGSSGKDGNGSGDDFRQDPQDHSALGTYTEEINKDGDDALANNGNEGSDKAQVDLESDSDAGGADESDSDSQVLGSASDRSASNSRKAINLDVMNAQQQMQAKNVRSSHNQPLTVGLFARVNSSSDLFEGEGLSTSSRHSTTGYAEPRNTDVSKSTDAPARIVRSQSSGHERSAALGGDGSGSPMLGGKSSSSGIEAARRFKEGIPDVDTVLSSTTPKIGLNGKSIKRDPTAQGGGSAWKDLPDSLGLVSNNSGNSHAFTLPNPPVNRDAAKDDSMLARNGYRVLDDLAAFGNQKGKSGQAMIEAPKSDKAHSSGKYKSLDSYTNSSTKSGKKKKGFKTSGSAKSRSTAARHAEIDTGSSQGFSGKNGRRASASDVLVEGNA